VDDVKVGGEYWCYVGLPVSWS